MPHKKMWPVSITRENYPEFIGQSSEHIIRKGSDLAGYFEQTMEPDRVIYEVYEAETDGHIRLALTVIKPGKIGNEFHMTKGHFHEDDRAGEVYFCLDGEGMVIMQTMDGQTDEIDLKPGAIAYIPPGWAHRTMNTGKNDLVMLAAYPETSGHDYDHIRENGFIKRVFEIDGKVKVV